MLLDPETLDLAQGIEAVLADVPREHADQVKPELFQSVLEVATTPCASVADAAEQLAGLRRLVGSIAERNGMLLGAAGTHPFARCDDQEIVDRPRYRELIADLGFIAERELIFGTHVHVGIDSADKAIYVADGIRRHLPLLLALLVQLALLGGAQHGHDVGADARLPRLPASGRPAPLRQLGDLLPAGRADDRVRARSTTTRTSGGTSARIRGSAPSRRGSSTRRPASRTPPRSPP